MARKPSLRPDLVALPMLAQETLYVGVDVGKKAHVAGFISSTLLTRHQRFEHCPALAFDNSRELLTVNHCSTHWLITAAVLSTRRSLQMLMVGLLSTVAFHGHHMQDHG